MAQPNNGISINREELAWAAGFFDGEGTTCICRGVTRDQTFTHLRVCVAQKDRRVLDRFHEAIGFGKVYKNQARPWSPYDWCVSSFEDCQATLAMLWPFLSLMKKEQAMRALTAYWSQPRQSPADRIEHMRMLGQRKRIGPRSRQKQPGTSSQFMGVTLDKRTGRWIAQVKSGGRNRNLGTFGVEKDAARAYDIAAAAAFGEFAALNFPDWTEHP